MSAMFRKGAYLLTRAIGKAENEVGQSFELLLVNGHLPALRSDITGKTFVVGWEDIIKLAMEAGIDLESEDEPRKH